VPDESAISSMLTSRWPIRLTKEVRGSRCSAASGQELVGDGGAQRIGCEQGVTAACSGLRD